MQYREYSHAPGFGSAARYIAHAVRDISKDLESMQNFEQVRIIETMGRHVGKFLDPNIYYEWLRPLVGQELQSFPMSLIGRSKSKHGEFET